MEDAVATGNQGPNNLQAHSGANSKVLQPHKHFSKRHSAIYIQLRTEKIGMNDFLFKRRVPGITDPRCDCGEGRQTVAVRAGYTQGSEEGRHAARQQLASRNDAGDCIDL
ncbi:hypothetical protein EDB81DRAFT_673095 [Dactylonectria macrodidyma]|uniref:Uncharacterized protein n=1 Tax=Dactylonectria macrodidyma TaxID=307937 RepID=A0A9P9I723_9HYPO|nr:hypothetical protein EDB81DRAFT_673095 [Dactylonectria macrodidyma]